jgi:hypothetical protein
MNQLLTAVKERQLSQEGLKEVKASMDWSRIFLKLLFLHESFESNSELIDVT